MRVTKNITSGFKNTTPKLIISKRHLTESTRNITANSKNITQSARNIRFISTIIFTVFISAALSSNNVSALTYQDAVDVSFTFDPTLSISLSGLVNGGISIANLVPGNYNNSNTISINVSTNNVYGYTLTAKVGGVGQTSAGSSLVNTDPEITNTFTSLSTSDNLTLANFNDNTWGYTTASSVSSNSIYSGLLYNSDTIINVTKNITGSPALNNYPGTNTTNFTIGAKASGAQLAGEYSNVITFAVVSNSTPLTILDLIYLQDFDTLSPIDKSGILDSMADDTNYTLKDRRDDNAYTIKKINGQIWMTQNLRTMGTISAEYSNFTGDDFNVSAYSLDENDATYAGHCDETNGYYYACAKNSGDITIGVWYNFASATAGTIVGYSNTSDVTEDICPSGWHLPIGSPHRAGDFYELINSKISLEVWASVTPGIISFEPTTGGSYVNGTISAPSHGSYWSAAATSLSEHSRYRLGYRNNGIVSDYWGRFRGFFIRCITS